MVRKPDFAILAKVPLLRYPVGSHSFTGACVPGRTTQSSSQNCIFSPPFGERPKKGGVYTLSRGMFRTETFPRVNDQRHITCVGCYPAKSRSVKEKIHHGQLCCPLRGGDAGATSSAATMRGCGIRGPVGVGLYHRARNGEEKRKNHPTSKRRVRAITVQPSPSFRLPLHHATT